MRKRIMDGLRKAGDAINDFDKSYADAVKHRVYGDDPRGVRSTLGDILGARWGDVELDKVALQSDIVKEAIPGYVRGAMYASEYAIPAAGYAARYALPAAGVALAGKGLHDLTQGLYAAASSTPVFGGPEDGAQPGQLGM